MNGSIILSRTAFLAGAAAFAGCSDGGALRAMTMREVAGGIRKAKSLAQSMSSYQPYSVTPNGYQVMTTPDFSTMVIFDPGGSYVAGGSITGVDTARAYIYCENNASRYDSLILSGSAPYNPSLNSSYSVDAVTTVSCAVNGSGQYYSATLSDVTQTNLTAVDANNSILTDTASFQSQTVHAGLAVSTASGSGGACGGHVCANAGPAPSPVPARGHGIRHTSSVSLTCTLAAASTVGAMANYMSKILKVGLRSGGIVVTLIPEIDLLALGAAGVTIFVTGVGSFLICMAQNKAEPK